ncbi:MAG: outer membrane lipoprotein carrier protein LolA [Tepidisphaeraceae bacterium]|jgi:outer membrane lipoprotein-sorting protein
MKTIGSILVMSAAFWLAQPSVARGQTTRADSGSNGPATRASLDLLEGVQNHLRSITSVQTDFVEKKNLAMLDHTLTISGHMAMEKPDRLIWVVRLPVQYAIRIRGDEVSQWDEDTNHVDVIHLGGDPTFKAVSEQMQAWFLGNYKVLGDSYEVFVVAEHPLSLRFVPKGDTMVAKLLKEVDVTFSADEDYIDGMVVRETGGDTTTLNFTNARLNQPVEKATWEMPPNDR